MKCIQEELGMKEKMPVVDGNRSEEHTLNSVTQWSRMPSSAWKKKNKNKKEKKIKKKNNNKKKKKQDDTTNREICVLSEIRTIT